MVPQDAESSSRRLSALDYVSKRKAEWEREIEALPVSQYRADRARVAGALDVAVCVAQRAACRGQNAISRTSKDGLYGCTIGWLDDCCVRECDGAGDAVRFDRNELSVWSTIVGIVPHPVRNRSAFQIAKREAIGH